MKNNLIKIILASVLAVGSAKAVQPSYVRDGYNFQNVNDIDGNVTKSSGTLAGRITVITTDQRWKADTIYVLNNLTFVEAPAVLTIEAGCIIRGETVTSGGTSTLDPADPGSLIICRGAKIVAQGTSDSPIYFTSWGDPFVPGGLLTIPSTLNGAAKDAAARALDAARYSTAAYNGSFTAHDIDAQWGGLTILGRAPVGFGGGTGSGGNLQVAIPATSQGANYTQNPKFVFSNGGAYSLEALFNPVAVASVRVDNGGKFTGSKPTFKATAADGSRTATKTVLGTPVVGYNNGTNGTFEGTGTSGADATATGGDDYWEIASVGLAVNSSTDSNRGGLQYNVPTKSGTDPFLKANGFSKAEVALTYTHTTGYLTTSASTEWSASGHDLTAPTNGLPGAAVGSTVCTAYPVLRLILNPTYLYGVIVKAPNASVSGVTVLTPATVPTLTISQGGTSPIPTQATAICSVAAAVADPSAIPLKGGIGANFIEGFQAIDGAAYGLSSAPTVDSDGAAWTTYSGGIYGGSNSADNSGCIRFCRFSFGGYVLSPNNEINGVTYGGVGSGTVTEFVEVFNNADDDFEMFGGNNNLKYCAGIFGGDDTYDTDMGYRGKGQFLFALQNNTQSSNGDTARNVANIGDNLGENDGNEDPNYIKNSTYPGTEFTYFNGTWIGVGYNCKGTFPSDRAGPNFKDNSGGKIFNSVYVEAPSGAMQDQATTALLDDGNGAGARRIVVAPQVPQVAGEPQGALAFNTWSKCGGGKSSSPNTANYTSSGAAMFPITSGRTSSGGSTINNSVAVAKTLVAALSNLFVSTDVVTSTGTNGRLAGVNPVLASAALEVSGTNPRGSAAVLAGAVGNEGLQTGTVDRGAFFTANTFRGAFYKFNWLKKWTLADRLGVYAANSVEVPEVTTTRGTTGTVVVSFTGASGQKYSIETSSDNKTYTSVETVDGAGATITRDLGRANQMTFTRVTPL